MGHNLKIEVEDVYQHTDYIRVHDWSAYDKILPITNRVLKVEIPGVEGHCIVPFPQGAGFIYSAKVFKLAKEPIPLNDGLWIFTYSVCPNEKVFTIVYHFRSIQLEETIFRKLAAILSSNTITDEEQKQNYTKMTECLLMLKSLRCTNIDRFNAQDAYKLYQSIENLLNSVDGLL